MRILQISKYFYPAVSFGGPVQCVYNISKHLVKRGHEVVVYTTTALSPRSSAFGIKEKMKLVRGVKVFYFRNMSTPYKLFISPSIISALRKNIDYFDIVHLHEYRTFQNLSFYYFRKRIPYVISPHGEVLPTYGVIKGQRDLVLLRTFFDHIFGRKLLDRASKVITTTKSEATQFIGVGVDSNKIEIVPNGIAPEDFSNSPPFGYFRELYGISEEDIILYLGRIHRRKGIDILVKAFSLLVKQRNNVKLVIAGADDGYMKSLKELIEKHRLRDKILITGYLSHKQKLAAYKDATIVACPSLSEIFGIVAIEAAIFQKPIVVSNDSGAAEVVSDGKFGLLTKYGDSFDLKNALVLLLNDKNRRRKLGENGRNYVMSKLTWDRIVDRLEKLYLSLI